MICKNIVVTGSPRSGTTMIVSALNNIDDFKVYGELFAHTKKAEHPQAEWNKIVQENIDEGFDNSVFKHPVFFVMDIFSRATGMKILSPHFRWYPELIPFVKENATIIHIERRNKFNQAISSAVNRKREKIRVDPKWLLSNIEDSIKDNLLLDSFFSDSKYMKIYYEDITQNQNKDAIGIPGLSEFLGQDVPEILYPKVRKQGSPKVSKRITNLKEVYWYFKTHRSDLLDWVEEK